MSNLEKLYQELSVNLHLTKNPDIWRVRKDGSLALKNTLTCANGVCKLDWKPSKTAVKS